MNKTQLQTHMLTAIAFCGMLVSTTSYCTPKKALTYEELMGKAQAAQDKHTKALAQADKHLRDANKYRAQARQIKMGKSVKPLPAAVQQEMLPEDELEMPVTIQPVTLETPRTYRTTESITPSKKDVYEEAYSVSTPVQARATRAR